MANLRLAQPLVPIEDTKTIKKKINPKNDFDLDEFRRDMGWELGHKRKKKPDFYNLTDIKPLTEEFRKETVDAMLKKTVITPGFEQLDTIPPYMESKRMKKAKNHAEKEKSKGKKWFNLPAPEITDDVRHDLEVIQMRSVLDPKHFYKKNDIKALPKYFQIGKVVNSPVDYYSGRLTKKESKKTIVDELMADAEFAKYNKRKYKEIISEKRKTHYRAHRHAKKLKGRKK
ncbi:deoxynucleotidyltransferase terminal-interacting protein 2 [Prorops nasuta]|uniref:deoxynucleotidyltransferase terminal-interacting protein 2 n=1 Tax=Prorops nasuta TaxID=863751 RepID=UPI0034CEBE52